MNTKCETCSTRCKSVFASLSAAQCSEMDRVRQVVMMKAGDDLSFSNNQNENVFYCLHSGAVKISSEVMPDHKKPLRLCGPGELVGFDYWNRKNELSATLLEDSEICTIQKNTFHSNQMPDLNEAILTHFARELDLCSERIMALQNYNVKARVAGLLISLSRKFGIQTVDGVHIAVHVDRKTIAGLSGTVIETLSRVLKELEEQQLISRVGRKIYVKSVDALIAISHHAS